LLDGLESCHCIDCGAVSISIAANTWQDSNPASNPAGKHASCAGLSRTINSEQSLIFECGPLDSINASKHFIDQLEERMY